MRSLLMRNPKKRKKRKSKGLSPLPASSSAPCRPIGRVLFFYAPGIKFTPYPMVLSNPENKKTPNRLITSDWEIFFASLARIRT